MATGFRRNRKRPDEEAAAASRPDEERAEEARAEGRSAEDHADADSGDEAPLTREEELERERDELLDRWRRAHADYQNLRRRQRADIDAAVSTARMALLGELLLVLDYLDMALGSPVTTDEGRNLLYGVQMTRDQLAGLLEREGAAPVDSSGDFDPQVHQAVAIVETDEVPPGRIVETVRRGWTIGEHVLRHAHVKVAEAPGTGAQAAADAVEGSEAPAEDEDA